MKRSSAWHVTSLGLLLLTAGCKRPADPAAGKVEGIARNLAPASATPLARRVAIDPVGEPRGGSVVALGKVGGKTLAFVADEDGLAVRVVDVDTMRETSSLALGGRPGQLLVSRAGQLWVTLRDEAGVAVLAARDDQTLERLKTVPTAVEPIALAEIDAAGVKPAVLVASGWGHSLERFDSAAFTRDFLVDLPREPRAVLASRDGSTAFVAHSAHGGLTVVALSDAAHALHDVDLGEPPSFGSSATSEMPSPKMPIVDVDGPTQALRGTSFAIPARFARQGFSLVSYQARSGESVLVPNAEMMTGNPRIVSSGYGGGGVESAGLPTEQLSVSAIDVATGRRSSVKEPTAHACRLPRAAAIAGDTLLLACMGGDEVVAVSAADPTKFRGSLSVTAGPAGLAVDPATKNAYVVSLFDASLTRVPLDAFVRTAPVMSLQVLRFVRPSALGQLADRGRKIFHAGGDSRIAKDGRACASCHPDGRDDGLVWSTPEGPRQTISLAGRVRHEAPFGWMGKHQTLQEHMRVTMKNLKGTGLGPEDEDALATYLTAMKGPPSVTSARPLTAEEEHGRDVFESGATGCGSCHGGPDRSDHDVHDVQSKIPVEQSPSFLAPSLVGIAGSAPYFHDGRYRSLEQLIDGSEGKMGNTAFLSTGERDALLAYLRTL